MSPTVKDTQETSVQRTIREHEDLHHRMAAIRRQAETVSPGAPLERLLASLDELQSMLAAHFAFEEETGLPEDLALRLPFVAEKTHALRHDHVRILERMKTLSAEGREASTSGGEAIAGFGRGVLALLEAISQHEENETSLIQDAYLDDIGGAG